MGEGIGVYKTVLEIFYNWIKFVNNVTKPNKFYRKRKTTI